MCFILSNPSDTMPIALIAKKDIVCWKLVQVTKRGVLRGYYRSKFRYILNKVYNTRFGFEDGYDYDYKCIHKGFHSYQKKKDLLREEWGYSFIFLKEYEYTKLVKCVIPKGTKYYKNTNQYVSKSIKLVKII